MLRRFRTIGVRTFAIEIRYWTRRETLVLLLMMVGRRAWATYLTRKGRRLPAFLQRPAQQFSAPLLAILSVTPVTETLERKDPSE